MKALIISVFVISAAVAVLAQAALPELDPATKQTLSDLSERDKALAVAESLALEAVKKTPEYQRLTQVQEMRRKAQAEIQKRVTSAVPGYQLEFSRYELVPVKMP